MTSAAVSLITVSMTAGVTILGWLLVHFLTRKREDRTRRIELSMRRHERQIEEFYGPIYSLVQLIWNVWLVKEEFMEKLSPNDNPGSPEEIKAKIDDFISRNYFLPIHEEIRTILKTKLHLIEGAEMPTSYYDYLGHAIMQNVQMRLWNEAGISTKNVRGQSWSKEFADDVKAGFDEAMQGYRLLIRELEEPQLQLRKDR